MTNQSSSESKPSTQTKIDEITIRKIADLAQLSLTPDEEKLYAGQLEKILEYVSELSKVNTDGIETMVTAVQMPVTFREDIPRRLINVEEALSNSPERVGNLFKVPPVL